MVFYATTSAASVGWANGFKFAHARAEHANLSRYRPSRVAGGTYFFTVAPWELPLDDTDFSSRWQRIKRGFSRGENESAVRSNSQGAQAREGRLAATLLGAHD